MLSLKNGPNVEGGRNEACLSDLERLGSSKSGSRFGVDCLTIERGLMNSARRHNAVSKVNTIGSVTI